MGQSCDLVFPLPEQTSNSRSSRKSRLEKFRETIDNLPYGDQERAAHDIFNVLYKSNRMTLKTVERLFLLQKVEEPTFHILNGLQEQIKDLAAPIRRKEERIAKVLVGTHFELALSYRCLLEKPPVKGILRTLDREAMANYLRLAIYHMGEVLRAKYNAMNNPGGTIWKYVYTLFACAYEQDIHTISLSSLPWCIYNTVEDTFKSVVLLAISSPLTMRGTDFNTLYELAPELTSYIELGKIKCGQGYAELSTFNLSGTEPPKKQIMSGCDSCGNSSNCFALSTKPLLNLLGEQVKVGKSSRNPTPLQKFLNEQYQLDNLLRNLGGAAKADHSERVPGANFSVEMVAGFSGVYAVLDQDATLQSNSTEEDITLQCKEDWTNTGIVGSGHRKTVCKVINHSSGGYCLYIDAKQKFQLWVGELVIVRESSGTDWHPAAVSWVSGNKDRMDFGIKLLANSVHQGQLRPIYNNSSDGATNCLLLSDEEDKKSPTRVITASSDFSKGDTLLVKDQYGESKISVRRIQSKTNGYTEYLCDFLGISEDTSTTDQVEREYDEVAEKEIDLETDFDSLWNQL